MLGLLIILHTFICIVLVFMIVMRGGNEMFVSQYSQDSLASPDESFANILIKIFIFAFFINTLIIGAMVSKSDTETIEHQVQELDSIPVN